MSDTVKLIIEIPADVYRTVQKNKSSILTTKQDDQEIVIGVRKGILLDDVKAEISGMEYHMIDCDVLVSQEEVLEILDNIGSEVKPNE